MCDFFQGKSLTPAQCVRVLSTKESCCGNISVRIIQGPIQTTRTV